MYISLGSDYTRLSALIWQGQIKIYINVVSDTPAKGPRTSERALTHMRRQATQVANEPVQARKGGVPMIQTLATK